MLHVKLEMPVMEIFEPQALDRQALHRLCLSQQLTQKTSRWLPKHTLYSGGTPT